MGGGRCLQSPAPTSLQERRNSLSIWGRTGQPQGESSGALVPKGLHMSSLPFPSPSFPGSRSVHHQLSGFAGPCWESEPPGASSDPDMHNFTPSPK